MRNRSYNPNKTNVVVCADSTRGHTPRGNPGDRSASRQDDDDNVESSKLVRVVLIGMGLLVSQFVWSK